MSSQHSEGVAFEQKTQPVPSSDKMALDLDINGTATRNETNHDTAPIDVSLKEASLPSPSSNASPAAVALNGANNADAFTSNHTNKAGLESLENSPTSAPSSSHLQETNTTTTDAMELSTSPEAELADKSTLATTIDSAIDTAVGDVVATSAVPPVVEAPESDTRTTELPLKVEAVESGSQMSPPASNLAVEADVQSPRLAEEPMLDITENVKSAAAVEPTVKVEASDLQPVTPDETPTPNNLAGIDTEMVDAPGETSQSQTSTKIAREREDDDVNEPSAKRTKTEESETIVAPVENGTSATENSGFLITPHKVAHITKIMSTVSKTPNGKHFRKAVALLWPELATQYLAVVSQPMDLATISKKAKDGRYKTMSEVIADVRLLHSNTVKFNGAEHVMVRSAIEVRDTLLSRLNSIPPEPVVFPKKEKKPKKPTPARDATPRISPPRRQSRGSHPAPGPSVTAAASTFALDPKTNMPLIRRDSTKVGGDRPVRQIHPPKSKDLPYSVRPKGKRNVLGLKFCQDVLTEIMKPKYAHFVGPFIDPVDPVALNIPTYFDIIKNPMDLTTVRENLKDQIYGSADEFERDIRQIITNCYTFNPPDNPVSICCRQFEELFISLWEKKSTWIAERDPPAASSPSVPDEDEDDEDEEEDVGNDAPNRNAHQLAKDRLLEEQTKLLDLMKAKHHDSIAIDMQTQMVALVQKMVNDAEAAMKQTKKAKPRAPKSNKKAAAVAAAPKRAQPASKQRAGNAKPKKREPERYMGTLEKETISLGIMSLPEEQQSKVLDLIKREQDVEDADGCVELDIESISTPLLWQIYDLVKLHLPYVEEQVRLNMVEKEAPKAPPKPTQRKKNKPMSKTEQERKIAQLSEKVQEFQRHTSNSQEPVLPTVENQQEESSGDEDSDSEEE